MDIRSKLLPWVVPSPGALRATGMTIDMITDADRLSHYEMVRKIHATLSKACPATFIGYNSMRFDEELLRQAFYQNLHPPYLTNTGGSTRADALQLVRAAVFLYPGSIIVPMSEKGRPSFRLDMLAPANGPDLWARFLRFSSKARTQEFLQEEHAFVVLEVGANRASPYVVTAIGDLGQSSMVYAYDLKVDPADLWNLSDADLAKRMARRPNPLRTIKTNQSPTLIPLADAPEQILDGISPEEFVERGRFIRGENEFTKRLLAVAEATATTYEPSPFVERQIYDGFYSRADDRRMENFHRASWEERAIIAETFEDGRATWLARRLLFAERPDLLAVHHRAAMAGEKAGRMIATDEECGGWTTLGKAQVELEAIIVDMTDDAAESFRRLGAYYEGKLVETAGVLQGL